jgi:hypothetical protein
MKGYVAFKGPVCPPLSVDVPRDKNPIILVIFVTFYFKLIHN